MPGSLSSGRGNTGFPHARLSTHPAVEDETAIADTVLFALRAEGYAAEHCLLGDAVVPLVRSGDSTWWCSTSVCRRNRLRRLPACVAFSEVR